MLYIGTLLTLFVPGLIATGLHLRISRDKSTPGRVAYWLFLYAFAIAALLGVLKILRGKGEINLVDSFNTVNNLVKYGFIALVLSLILPFLWRVFYLIYRRAAHALAGNSGRAVRALLGGLLDSDEALPHAPNEVQPRDAAPALAQESGVSIGRAASIQVAPLAEKAPVAEVVSAVAEESRAEARARRTEESFAAQEAEMAVDLAKVVPKRRSSDGPKRMLYNIGVRDAKAMPKTSKQRTIGLLIYGFMVFLVFVIVYGVLQLS